MCVKAQANTQSHTIETKPALAPPIMRRSCSLRESKPSVGVVRLIGSQTIENNDFLR